MTVVVKTNPTMIDQSTERPEWKEKLPAYKNTLTFLSREEQLAIIQKEIEAYSQK